MKIVLPLLLIIMCFSCNEIPSVLQKIETVEINDTHSYAQPAKAVVKHLDLSIHVNFDSSQISGKASWTIKNLKKAKEIIFDTRDLQIEKITLGAEEKPTEFIIDSADAILGNALHVSIEAATGLVNIYYTTSKNAGALQWLQPKQTAGKRKPFLFTQSQPILARSWVPCQDGPAIRFTYNATVSVPKDLLALMSAENPKQKNDSGVYHFKQVHPIPSYLLALAVGDLKFKPIDERTGVYAEPATIEKAAYEFADMGAMVNAAEKLYGPYRWDRYDVLVLPPSFPYGGMENPNLTFVTPTVIAGDRSLVSLIAHELAHSWSGNLVTNATWEEVWLNEGFTTYFERRIIEAVYGKEEAKMQEVLGKQSLEKDVKRLGDKSDDTKLKTNLTGRDPDDGPSDIPYEKGYFFLRNIEDTVGRAALDTFLRHYFDKYAFQSRNSEQFLEYLNKELIKNDKSIADKVNQVEWIYQPGLPKHFPKTGSVSFNAIDSILKQWYAGPNNDWTKFILSSNQKLYFITHLPDTITNSQMEALDKIFKFTQTKNAEVQAVWYLLAIHQQYKPANKYIENFLTFVGRRKFILPLYRAMVKTTEGKEWANKIYAKARENYHPVTYNSVDEILK